MSTPPKEVVVVIGPGGIGRAIARRVGAGRVLLLAGHSEQETKDVAGQLRGADLLMDGGVTSALRSGELTISS